MRAACAENFYNQLRDVLQSSPYWGSDPTSSDGDNSRQEGQADGLHGTARRLLQIAYKNDDGIGMMGEDGRRSKEDEDGKEMIMMDSVPHGRHVESILYDRGERGRVLKDDKKGGGEKKDDKKGKGGKKEDKGDKKEDKKGGKKDDKAQNGGDSGKSDKAVKEMEKEKKEKGKDKPPEVQQQEAPQKVPAPATAAAALKNQGSFQQQGQLATVQALQGSRTNSYGCSTASGSAGIGRRVQEGGVGVEMGRRGDHVIPIGHPLGLAAMWGEISQATLLVTDFSQPTEEESNLDKDVIVPYTSFFSRYEEEGEGESGGGEGLRAWRERRPKLLYFRGNMKRQQVREGVGEGVRGGGRVGVREGGRQGRKHRR